MRLYYLCFIVATICFVLGDEDVVENKDKAKDPSSEEDEKDNIISEKQITDNIVIEEESRTVPINNLKVVQDNVSGNKYDSFSEDQNNNRDDEQTISDIRKEAENQFQNQENMNNLADNDNESNDNHPSSDNQNDGIHEEVDNKEKIDDIDKESNDEGNFETPLSYIDLDTTISENDDQILGSKDDVILQNNEHKEKDNVNNNNDDEPGMIDIDTRETDEEANTPYPPDIDTPGTGVNVDDTNTPDLSDTPKPPDLEDIKVVDLELLDIEKDDILSSSDDDQEKDIKSTDSSSTIMKDKEIDTSSVLDDTRENINEPLNDNIEAGWKNEEEPTKEAVKIQQTPEEIDDATKLYNQGKEFEKTDKKSYKKLLLSAAELGHTKAMEEVAYSLLFGDDIKANGTKASEYFQKLADNGSPVGQQGLGYLFSTGLHGNSSQAKALIYTTFSALGGDTMAEMMLGYRHYSGAGVQKSCETALTYYKKVAKKVSNTASSYIGSNAVQRVRLYDELEQPGGTAGQIDEDLLQYYQFLADKGDTQAQIGLGQLYFQGGRGVEINYKKAFEYFDMASKAGNSNGHAYIGKMYLQGLYVDKDPLKAHDYFQKSLKEKSPVGQAGLGMIYLKGEGVKKDYANALKYFSQSAEQGWVEGQLQLGNMYYNGIGVKKDYRQAVKYFTFASQSGHVLAFYNLAMMHTIGAGVMRSCTAATELFKNVAERGKWAVMFMDAHDSYKNGDMKTALMKYYYLAELGYEVAQSNVAYILDKDDVSFFDKNQTYARALLQWSRAAEQGYAVARVKLGDYYFYGLGTKVNYEVAALHYRLASDKQGNAQAMFNLGYMHEQGFGLKKDIHLAKRFYDMAAEASPDAQFPVYLALSKLALEFTIEWFENNYRIWENVDTNKIQLSVMQVMGPDWDIYLITFLTGLLGLLLLFRRGQQR